jgi:L1 cell adhesion molecule like protein
MGMTLIQEMACQIKKEMKHVCSESHDSILRDSVDGVKQFSWETVWVELQRNIPTLITLLEELVSNDRPLLCLIVSMLLKKRYPKMGLVQRAISILLYGNGTNAQVYDCLQPLMICYSHRGTIKLLDRLAVDYDIDVQYWSNSLLSQLEDPLDNITYNFGVSENEEDEDRGSFAN